MAKPTYRQAQDALLDHLEREGWRVARHLKVPHATKGRDPYAVRIWFKPQALWYSCGEGGSLASARSLWIDVRDASPAEVVAAAERACREPPRRDRSRGLARGGRSKKRYLLRGFAPNRRSKRGEVFVRTTVQEFDDPHEAAVALWSMQQPDHGRAVPWRYEVVDRGEGGRRTIGPVVTVEELKQRAGSRDRGGRRHARRDAGTTALALASAALVGYGLYESRARARGERITPAGKKLYEKSRREYERTGKHYWYAVTEDGLDMSVGRHATKAEAKKAGERRARKLGRGPRIEQVYHLDSPERDREPPSTRRGLLGRRAPESTRHLSTPVVEGELTDMTYMLHRAGYVAEPRRIARALRERGVSPAELAFRLQTGELSRDRGGMRQVSRDHSKRITLGYQAVDTRTGETLSPVHARRAPAREVAARESRDGRTVGVRTIEAHVPSTWKRGDSLEGYVDARVLAELKRSSVARDRGCGCGCNGRGSCSAASKKRRG